MKEDLVKDLLDAKIIKVDAYTFVGGGLYNTRDEALDALIEKKTGCSNEVFYMLAITFVLIVLAVLTRIP
jgi:hypothetical protein